MKRGLTAHISKHLTARLPTSTRDNGFNSEITKVELAESVPSTGNAPTNPREKVQNSLSKEVDQFLRKSYRIDGRKKAVKNWILTAYNPHAGDDSSAIRGINQGQAAPPPAYVGDKVTTNSSDVQAKSGKGAKFSLGGRSIA